MLSDIEIAQKTDMRDIAEIAKKIGIGENGLERYGAYKAKLNLQQLRDLQSSKKRGHLILVTAMTPTPAGEGKSTVSIGLADGLSRIGKKTSLALREPSLGPCFGVKGGACGGGFAQIVPMDEINLHFTGDIHAISIANNLIASLIDNHLQQGNELNLDERTISWKRCVDLNDRALRNVIVGLGGKANGVPREDHFTIAVASEIMAIVCLSRSISELKEKLGNIVIGENDKKEFVRLRDLQCVGAVAALLKDAIKPNLVQTLEGTPAFVHGGPFANIAHGCNSINATLASLSVSDYTVTEAGFAADLGAEKFFDIKSRLFHLNPEAAILVVTVRALKMHGGVSKENLASENIDALVAGFENVRVHIENLKKFGIVPIVAINKFITDTNAELGKVKTLASALNVNAVVTEAWEKGGAGAEDLAHEVVNACEKKSAKFSPLYSFAEPLATKIETLAKEIYRAKDVAFEAVALKKLSRFEKEGYGNLPVCMAKTQNSISHDASKKGAPENYTFPIRDVQLYAGAGFVVAFAGDIVSMPGLPKKPAALSIDVDDDGVISGLF